MQGIRLAKVPLLAITHGLIGCGMHPPDYDSDSQD